MELCNKWEEWEPEKKSRKDPIRTFWREAEEEKNDTMEEASVEEWWESGGRVVEWWWDGVGMVVG